MTPAITDATGIDAIDLVDLDAAPPTVGYEALSRGVLLLGDEAAAVELEAEFLSRKLDFAPVKEKWQEALKTRLRRGTYGRA
jgi:hypothetical protein